MRGLALAALIATPALAGSQSLSDDVRLPSFEGGQAIVRVHVLQESPYEGSEITIYAAPTNVVGADPVDQALSAIAIRTHASAQVARSVNCPGLRTALQALRLIAPVQAVPTALRPRPSMTLPIEPTKKDGARYEITMQVAAPNTAGVLMTIDDYSGDYAAWADGLRRDLSSCWSRWP